MNDFHPLSQEERNAPSEVGGDVRKEKARDPRPFIRSSRDAPRPPKRHPTLGVPAYNYLYTDEHGAPSLFAQRFEFPDAAKKKGKRKIFIQWSLRQDAGGLEWIPEGFPDGEQLPLFNLPEILANPDKYVVLIEGEKKIDAALVIFGDTAVVTTTAMGAGSFLRTDATPLAGRPILIWPDNDAAGQGYARTATEALRRLGCAISVVDVAELVKIDGGGPRATHNPDGWDCEDAVIEWSDHAALRAKVMELAKPYDADETCTDNTTVPGGDAANQEIIRSELLDRIKALDGMDEASIRAIVGDAIRASLSDLAVGTLLKQLAHKLSVGLPDARKFWQKIEKEIRAAEEALKDKKREALSREEQEAKVRERARKLEEERAATRQRLELSCREIANDPKLLTSLTKIARKAGVIGENASVCGAYIAASSRFNRRKAICLLRRGAPVGGKNFVTDTVLRFIPEEDVVRVSSGSPLSLVYYGEGDEDALKYKIIYVAEAAILAERNGVESVLTIMLRLLISEGRIDHQVVVPVPNAPSTTRHIRRNGPVVVLVTSARNNIEEELLTRLMTSDADESQEQTEKVLTAVLEDEEDEEKVNAEIGQWVDYQRWIDLDAPYDVLIPYSHAILAAIRAQRDDARKRGEKPKFKLRIRRDIQGFLTAIRTSAILHKSQREKDSQGRIVATIDDYRNAHEAFDPGLASLYKIASPLTTIAVVRAIEEMGATTSTAVKLTVTTLMDKLGITGRGTANDRLRDAQERGYIELIEKHGGYGRTTPREYKIIRYAADIENEVETPFGQGAFPSPEAVEAELKNFSEEPVSPRYSGTAGTRRDSGQNYTDCTTVPEGDRPSAKIFTGGDPPPRQPIVPTIPTVPTSLRPPLLRMAFLTILRNRANRLGRWWTYEPGRHRRKGAPARRHGDAQRRRDGAVALSRRRPAE
jgi:hypothetical protein